MYFDDSSVTIEAASEFITYEEAKAQKLTKIPDDIQERFLLERMTEEDNLILKEAAKVAKAAENGKLHLPVLEDYKCISCSFTNTPSTSVSTGTSRKMPQLNDRLRVYWVRDEAYYPGQIIAIRGDFYHVKYDDGDSEWLPLAEHRFEFYHDKSKPKTEEVEEEAHMGGEIDRKGNSASKVVPQSSPLKLGATDNGTVAPVQPMPQPVSLKVRTNSDGTISPVNAPKQDSGGRFIRPKGRSPKNCEWNHRRGVWEPVPEGEGKSSLGKRNSLHSDDGLNSQKRVKNPQGSPTRLSATSTTLSETGAEALTPNGTTATGEPSSQSGSQSTPSLDRSSIEKLLLELTQCLGGIEGGKFRVESASDVNVLRAATIMDSIATMALQYSFFDNVLKPIRKLCGHSRLGANAKRLQSRIALTYDLELVRDWHHNLVRNNLEMVQNLVDNLHKRLDSKAYPFSLPEVTSEIGDIPKLIQRTVRLFRKHNVDPKKIETLQAKVVFLNGTQDGVC